MSFSLESLYKSLVKNIQNLRLEIIASGLSTDMQYYAWDTRGQETELPKTDLIGLTGWAFSENEGTPAIQAGIMLGMNIDKNGFKEIQALDIIRNKFVGKMGDYRTIPLLDGDTGIEYSQLQVADFEILPAGRSEIRTTRNIGVEFLLTNVG